MKKPAALMFALAFAVPALAQQYKWVDQDGKVRYGDLPPAGVKATPLKPPPGPIGTSSPAAAPAAKKDGKPLTPEQAFQKRQKEQAEAADKADKERADAGIKKSNCDNAQSNLRQLESGQRMTAMNSSGERYFIDDAQRAQQMDQARKAVSEWCN